MDNDNTTDNSVWDDIASISTETGRHYFTPRKILPEYTKMLFSDQSEQIKEIAKTLIAQGWRFYATNTQCGTCYENSKVITIPLHAFRRGAQYKTYYICHEMSHALVGAKHQHSAVFMRKLIDICPEDCIHYEIGYKPRNAMAAGISSIKSKVFMKQLQITKEQQLALVKLRISIKDEDWL